MISEAPVTKITPNADQQVALEKIDRWLYSDEQTFGLGGLAGTGKSTIIPLILDRYPETNIKICTPTGKAAAVVNRKFGYQIAKTIHSALYRPVGQVHSGRKDYLDRDLEDPIFEEHDVAAEMFVIDEASMVNEDVYDRLLRTGSKFLFIGDPGQLPPVGDDDLSPTLRRPDHILTEIVRQAVDSPIRRLAYEVRMGGPLTSYFEGIDYYQFGSTMELAERCHMNDVQMVIAPTNKLRAAMNAHLRNMKGYERQHPLSEGERVIITSNSHPYGVYNGETYIIGKVHSFSPTRQGEDGPRVKVELLDEETGEQKIDKIELGYQWRSAEAFNRGDAIAAELGYCLTGHKAQGSQAKRVAVINTDIGWIDRGKPFAHSPLWRYTAATRAETDLIIETPGIQR